MDEIIKIHKKIRKIFEDAAPDCPNCKGTGKEICDNPDHGFIAAIGGETNRLGCPCCGHDEDYAISGTTCETCKGTGKL